MAVSKVILNGTTLIDTTDKTVTAGSMLNGVTALKNDGTTATGSIASKSSTDLTASGATVTAPAGYYASAASKSVASGTAGTPTATKGTVSNHSVSVTPSVTNTAGYISGGSKTGAAVTVSASELVSGTKSISAAGETDVTNYAKASVATGSATTPTTTITANPTISVSTAGLITASVSGSQSVTPSVSAGYVSSGTAGTVSVIGSKTQQLTAKAATTYYPSTTDQTITSGQYLTGTQTIKAVTTTNLTAENIADGVTVEVGDASDSDRILSITGTHQGGTTPTGVKYVYSDVDGIGAWDVSGFAKCSYDYAPVRDNRGRIWIKLTDDLSISVKISTWSTTGVIEWGDGNQDSWSASDKTKTHTYSSSGLYVIEAYPTGGNMYFDFAGNAVGQSSSAPDSKVIGVEFYSSQYTTVRSAFQYCTNLKRFTAVGTQTSSSTSVLAGCTNLRDYDFPNTVASLDSAAFDGCASLIKASVPSGQTTMPQATFRNCSSLKEVHMKPTTPPTMNTSKIQTGNDFYGTPADLVIYVPQGSLPAYQSATNWSSFASQMQEESS